MAIQLGSAWGLIGLDASGVHKGVNDANSALGKLQGSIKNVFEFAMGNIVSRGITQMTRGLISLGAESMDMAEAFQSQVAIMSAAVDPAVASINDLHDAALTVGGDLSLVGIDASQAAEAITRLLKSGMNTNDIFGDMYGYLAGTNELFGVLRGSIDLQAASELDLAASSDLVSTAMKTFGLNANDATMISDNFVAAADASVASVSDLAEAMTNVGPTAASFEWSLQDTNTALAILSTRGIRGAEAGTALKSMMTNLMRPIDKVTGALNELGVELYDEEGQLKRLPEIIGQMSTSMARLTDKQRLQYIQTIAGTYGMKSLNTLLAEGVTGWEDMETAIGEANTASEVAAVRVNTLRGAEEALGDVVNTLKIRLGEAFVPLATTGAKAAATFIEDHGPGMAAAFEDIATAAENGIESAGKLFEAYEKGGLSGLGDALGIPPDVTASIEGIATKIGETFTSIGNAGKLIFGGEYTEGSIFGLSADDPIIGMLEGLRDIFNSLALQVGPALGSTLAFLNEHWYAFQNALLAIGAVLGGAGIVSVLASIGAVLAAINWPIVAIVAAVGLLAAAWTENWFGIRDILTGAWEALWPVLQMLWTWLSTTLTTALQTLSTVWQTVLWPAMQTVWTWMSEVLFPFFQSVGNFMSAVFEVALRALAGVWQNVLLPAIQAVNKWLKDNIWPIFQEVSTFVAETFTPVIDKLGKAFTTVADAIKKAKEKLDDLAEKLRNVKLPDWMTPGSPTPWEIGLLGVDAAMQTLNSDIPRLGRAMSGLSMPSMLMPAYATATAGIGGGYGYGSSSTTQNQSYDQRVIIQATVSSEVDIETLAYRVAEAIQRRQQ